MFLTGCKTLTLNDKERMIYDYGINVGFKWVRTTQQIPNDNDLTDMSTWVLPKIKNQIKNNTNETYIALLPVINKLIDKKFGITKPSLCKKGAESILTHLDTLFKVYPEFKKDRDLNKYVSVYIDGINSALCASLSSVNPNKKQ